MNNNSDSKTVSFRRVPAKHGKYYVFTIPNILIKTGEVDPNCIYKISITPLKKTTDTK